MAEQLQEVEAKEAVLKRSRLATRANWVRKKSKAFWKKKSVEISGTESLNHFFGWATARNTLSLKSKDWTLQQQNLTATN